MNSIMQSIHPEYCALIANGKKTIEVRKTRPKIDPPFKCYIYQTKTGYVSKSKENDGLIPIKYSTGKVIGEYICDRIQDYEMEGYNPKLNIYQGINRINYDEFRCDYIQTLECSNEMTSEEQAFSPLLKHSCLTFEQIGKYVCSNKPIDFYSFCGYHITDLVIYDKPKELKEFYQHCSGNGTAEDKKCINCPHLCFDNDLINGHSRWCGVYKKKPLARPPQSWCYVEEIR